MQMWHAKCEKLSPLLMNPMTEKILDSLWTGVRDPAPRDVPFDVICEGKVIRNEEGSIGFPVEYLNSAMNAAAREFKLSGNRKLANAQSSLLPAMLTVQEEFLPLTNGTPGEQPSWRVSKMPGRNPKDGVAVCIVRPRFDDWGFEVTIEIDEKQIKPSMIRQLLESTGSRIGLGDFRPARKGRFGRFKVTEWTRLDGEGNGDEVTEEEAAATKGGRKRRATV